MCVFVCFESGKDKQKKVIDWRERFHPLAPSPVQVSYMGGRDPTQSRQVRMLHSVCVNKKLALEAELGLKPSHSTNG